MIIRRPLHNLLVRPKHGVAQYSDFALLFDLQVESARLVCSHAARNLAFAEVSCLLATRDGSAQVSIGMNKPSIIGIGMV
jgi:hypothetical protein